VLSRIFYFRWGFITEYPLYLCLSSLKTRHLNRHLYTFHFEVFCPQPTENFPIHPTFSPHFVSIKLGQIQRQRKPYYDIIWLHFALFLFSLLFKKKCKTENRPKLRLDIFDRTYLYTLCVLLADHQIFLPY